MHVTWHVQDTLQQSSSVKALCSPIEVRLQDYHGLFDVRVRILFTFIIFLAFQIIEGLQDMLVCNELLKSCISGKPGSQFLGVQPILIERGLSKGTQVMAPEVVGKQRVPFWVFQPDLTNLVSKDRIMHNPVAEGVQVRSLALGQDVPQTQQQISVVQYLIQPSPIASVLAGPFFAWPGDQLLDVEANLGLPCSPLSPCCLQPADLHMGGCTASYDFIQSMYSRGRGARVKVRRLSML